MPSPPLRTLLIAAPTRIKDSWGSRNNIDCCLFTGVLHHRRICRPITYSMRIHTFFAAAFVAIASAHGTHGGGAHAGNYGEEARTDYPNWMARHMAGTQRIYERFAVHGHSALTARLLQC